METEDKILLSNSVGKITSKTVTVTDSKEVSQIIELNQIISFEYDLKRKYFSAATFFIIAGIVFFSFFYIKMKPSFFLVPVALGIGGMANLLGYYDIQIQTKKGTIKLDSVEFNKLKEGKAFVEMLEKMLTEN